MCSAEAKNQSETKTHKPPKPCKKKKKKCCECGSEELRNVIEQGVSLGMFCPALFTYMIETFFIFLFYSTCKYVCICSVCAP